MHKLGVVSRVVLVVILGIDLSAAAIGQESNGRSVPPRWGTKDLIFTHMGFNEFTPAASTTPYDGGAGGNFGRFSTVSNGVFWALAHVPSGALLTYLELDYCDTSVADNVQVVLWDCRFDGSDCNSMGDLLSSSGPSGCHFTSADLTSQNYTMNNNARELVVSAVTQSGNNTTQLNGVYIGYKLQISPAPPVATFGDVPTTHPFFRAVEALAASGITSGCGGGNFCPDKTLTRGEVAKFLAVALGLHFPD